jgi:hypothetical protein
MENTHAMTLRLSSPVYKAAKRLAKAEGISLNALVQVAIEDKARRLASKRLSAAYGILGEGADSDVESLLAAQIETLLNE